MQVTKAMIIAGNGPSVKSINYHRVPKEFDVFRTSQFFFEDKYYLGKNVTGYFMGNPAVENLFITSYILEQREEYFFDERYFSGGRLWEYQEYTKYIERFYPCINIAYDYFTKNKKILELINFYFIYNKKYPTTGIIMLFTAVVLGYKEIYLTGIDFFEHGVEYLFDIDKQSNFYQYIDRVADFSKVLEECHDMDIDKASIQLISQMNDISLYSISENSPINHIISLAPIQNDTPYIPEEKPQNYTHDWIKSPIQIQNEQESTEMNKNHISIVQTIKSKFIDKNLIDEWNFLRENGLVKICYQIIKLPYVILKIIIKLGK